MEKSKYEKYISRKPLYLTEFAEPSLAHAMTSAPIVWCNNDIFPGCNVVVDMGYVWADASFVKDKNNLSVSKHPHEEFFFFKGMDQ